MRHQSRPQTVFYACVECEWKGSGAETTSLHRGSTDSLMQVNDDIVPKWKPVLTITSVSHTDIAIGFVKASYTFLEGASNPSVVLRKDSGRISERTDIAVRVYLSGTFSATRGPDFEVALLNTKIDFAPNEQEETISLTIVEDNLPEELESFRLTIISVGLRFGPRSDTFATTEVFIRDNDGTLCV